MTVVVCGSFGFGNAGDEAIPLALSDLTESLGSPLQFAPVSRYDHPAMPSVIGMGESDKSRRTALQGSMVLMSGGGIIEPHSRAVLFRCASLLDRSFASKKCLFGVSVEPDISYGMGARWRIWRLLREMPVIYTRDKLSASVLHEILPSLRTETIGDLVLWMRADEAELPQELRIPARFIAVILAPRWSNDPAWRRWIVAELSAAARVQDAVLVFVPMTDKFDDDRKEHRAVADAILAEHPDIETMLIECPLTPRGISAILAKSMVTVSMRLHGCVMAYAQEVPFVSVAYHPKLFGFASTVGWMHALLPSDRPCRQAEGVYGFEFGSLNLKLGQLVEKVREVIDRPDFGALSSLKRKSADVAASLFLGNH